MDAFIPRQKSVMLLLWMGHNLIANTWAFHQLLPSQHQCKHRVQEGSCLNQKFTLNAMKEATFGMGCFWEPSESMLKLEGVKATKAGYCGGGENAKTPPSYDSVCYGRNWVEAVRVAYDDAVISYDELLEKFFELHKSNPGSRQYDSIIFADEAQMKVAKRWVEDGITIQRKRKDGYPVSLVKYEPLSSFWKAEDYHQDYWQKWRVRYVVAIALLAGASGSFDKFLPFNKIELLGFSCTIDSIFNAAVLTGCAGVVLERLIARNVLELKAGDLIASTEEQ